MSTRSEIGIQNADGTIESVYCHWDGYPAHNGHILFKHYTIETKVRELIKYGGLSILRENITPAVRTKHTFEESQKDVCVYYNRDRSEKWEDVKPCIHSNIEEWGEEISKGWQDYLYLFKNNKWYFAEIVYYGEGKNKVGEWKELTKEFLERELKREGWEW